jgi:hypothetical protein
MTEKPTAPHHADHIRRRQIFLVDRGARGGAVFRRQEAALLGQDHPQG